MSDASIAYDEAMKELRRKAQPDAQPTLSPEEVEDILTRNLRVVPWAASSAFKYGQYVQPDNGRRYRVIKAGTSGATSPSWPVAPVRLNIYTRIQDNGVIWEDDGEEYFGGIYDIRQAVYDAWQLKLAKASEYVSSSEARDVQMFEHCKRMVEHYEPILVA